MKKKVAILIGGQSTEHEVSLVSGASVLSHIDQGIYEIYLVGITKDGKWYRLPPANYLDNEADVSKVSLRLESAQAISISFEQKAFIASGNDEPYRPDVIFPVLHGKNGEDGSIQGLCQLLDIPVVGCGLLSSAICMDKDVTKRLLDKENIKNAKFITIREGQDVDTSGFIESLGLPLFVKSANGGSSVGVSKVHSEDELLPAIAEGFRYDTKVIIEEMVVGRELECSVFGSSNPVASAVLGEIILREDEFYSYDAKYVSETGVSLAAPADVDKLILEKIRSVALQTYRCLECTGLARIDLFLTANNDIYVNEINTLPGFTNISMYPKLWELSGVSYDKLVNNLINDALAGK